MNTNLTETIRRNPFLTSLTIAAALLAVHTGSRADIIYVVNNGDNTIRRFDSVTGANLGVFVHTGTGPEGLAFDSAGNLYVANWGNTIEKFTPGGVRSVFASTGLSLPSGLAFDSAGNLYAANRGNNTIEKFTPGGVGSVFASTELNSPDGLAFDSSGNLFVSNFGDTTIEKFTPGGVGSLFTSDARANPETLVFDRAGNLYVAVNNTTIAKFTPDGVHSVFASTGASRSMGLAFDSAGNLFSGNGNNTIEKFSPSGADLGLFASGLIQPYCLAIQPVPEPSTVALLTLGLSTALTLRFRTRKLTEGSSPIPLIHGDKR